MNKKNTNLTINQLKLNVFLGWPKNERDQLQTIIVDISISYPQAPAACETDQLDDTFCYNRLIEALRDHVYNQRYYLIEYLSNDIHKWLKSELSDEVIVDLKLTKFPAIKDLGSVTFSLGDSK